MCAAHPARLLLMLVLWAALTCSVLPAGTQTTLARLLMLVEMGTGRPARQLLLVGTQTAGFALLLLLLLLLRVLVLLKGVPQVAASLVVLHPPL
jgi:hypothetical protein